ncbi:MAG: effector-associated domain EAD1-containing protein [Microscillaceae bacterium]|nr:effector-associated domain EAD1-containing protein [Microscillaceae bacterium]
MHPNIQQALKHLQNANLKGYFKEMDKVVPDSMRHTLDTHKGIFIAGQAPWDFHQKLELFAEEVDKKLREDLIKPKNNPKNQVQTNNPNPQTHTTMQTQRQSIAILSADMKGFSAIKSDKIKTEAYKFIYKLVEKVKENDLFVLNSQNTHLVGNTWGDAIFLADNSTLNLAKIALKIRDEARQTDWEYELNLSEPIRFRIGLNFGEAEVLMENGKIINVIGGTVDLGARIEPATEVDAVFCSDKFWQMLEGKGNIKSIPKNITLPKNAGEIKAHKLLWEWEHAENNPTPQTNSMPLSTQEKINKLHQKIQEAEELKDEWEQKRMLAENPTERRRCESEILKLKKMIAEYEEELEALQNKPASKTVGINTEYPQTLSGKQKEAFCEALIAAYLKEEALEQFTSFKMDIQLNTLSAGKNLKSIVFDLVNYCEANGTLAKLIEEVAQDKGNNPKLKKFLESLI